MASRKRKTVLAVDGSHCIEFFFSLLGICDETTKIDHKKTICRTEPVSRKLQNGIFKSSPKPFFLAVKVQFSWLLKFRNVVGRMLCVIEFNARKEGLLRYSTSSSLIAVVVIFEQWQVNLQSIKDIYRGTCK
jgi:hypothetical protein